MAREKSLYLIGGYGGLKVREYFNNAFFMQIAYPSVLDAVRK
jgi:hypothetical protein